MAGSRDFWKLLLRRLFCLINPTMCGGRKRKFGEFNVNFLLLDEMSLDSLMVLVRDSTSISSSSGEVGSEWDRACRRLWHSCVNFSQLTVSMVRSSVGFEERFVVRSRVWRRWSVRRLSLE